MHHMHAGFVGKEPDNPRQKNRRAEKGWDEGGDAFGFAEKISPDTDGFEDESKNNRKCRHGREVCV